MYCNCKQVICDLHNTTLVQATAIRNYMYISLYILYYIILILYLHIWLQLINFHVYNIVFLETMPVESSRNNINNNNTTAGLSAYHLFALAFIIYKLYN